jgi:hypothetical protein
MVKGGRSGNHVPSVGKGVFILQEGGTSLPTRLEMLSDAGKPRMVPALAGEGVANSDPILAPLDIPQCLNGCQLPNSYE